MAITTTKRLQCNYSPVTKFRKMLQFVIILYSRFERSIDTWGHNKLPPARKNYTMRYIAVFMAAGVNANRPNIVQNNC